MPTVPPLVGTYVAPSVRLGERVGCLFRECECVVTSVSDGRITWPRVRRLDGSGGGSGLWVNAALERAVRVESAAALRYWFGVSVTVVWRWRKAFGVNGRATTKGSKRAIRAAALKGAAMKAREWTDDERDARAERAKRAGRKPPDRWTPERGGWTPEQLALLGTDHDEAIAKKLGRTRSAVTSRRVQRKIPAYSGWPGGGPAWKPEELALLGTDTDVAVAQKIGRTRGAVSQKRAALKVPAFFDRRRGGA